MFLAEITAYDLRPSLGAPQIRSYRRNHLRPIVRSLAAEGIALDVLVEQFVRIQLWTAVSRSIVRPYVGNLQARTVIMLKTT